MKTYEPWSNMKLSLSGRKAGNKESKLIICLILFLNFPPIQAENLFIIREERCEQYEVIWKHMNYELWTIREKFVYQRGKREAIWNYMSAYHMFNIIPLFSSYTSKKA